MNHSTIIRCKKCNRRLFDISNCEGKVNIQIVCPKCGEIWEVSISGELIKINRVRKEKEQVGK
ncbi:hypothetical protein Desde_3213 [Desulfitobacterium dehalogenans ATCC 51507]|uniref:Mu-like prophage protein Com n=1 Tax=Desulfitobacterium dehalogenans (strain ATCC 51507 / DSM 9161 / JW/IU-DC1) TaxID=756499 RepID=I4AC19_DESDJ|nr:hypothetical protein [Desulfitobacterium dehalogenans]AFM01504.1 hypothetical protein Desde_3213 [Desulfitobacterium dehalogenans ATCC 51507]